MFYLERLTSSSSHSLAATIGYAMSGSLGWRASLEPGDVGAEGRITLLAVPSPQSPHFQSPAVSPVPGATSPVPFHRRITWTAEIS